MGALPADYGSVERLRAVIEQVLVFTGAALAAVYAPGECAGELGLVRSVGVPYTLYGLRESYPLSADLPLAAAHRGGEPFWLTAADLSAHPEQLPRIADASLALLPLRLDGEALGCLVAVLESPDGFGAEDRSFLEYFAGRLSASPIRQNGSGPALVRRADGAGPPAGSFTLSVKTGQIDADERVLALFGLPPARFDGRVETLLAMALPEDLPALLAVIEPGRAATSGDRELEFRIRHPSGELLWLRLRSRTLFAPDGQPARLLGTVADASRLRSSADEVAKVQRLAAALSTAVTVQDVSRAVVGALREPLGADRAALAELESDHLVFTLMDPPQADAWPEAWRSEWRSEWPDAPLGSMPTLEAALRGGRPSVWPAGTPLETVLAEVGPGGLAVLPLPTAGRVVGACLLGWDEPHDFGPDERALLTATASLVGQALVRARAFDAEHELVGMMQRSLLPRRLPPLPGAVPVARYLPAMPGLEVGGDWYDVIPLPNGHAALVIGDVQGHNAQAATLMGQMRTAIRAYAVEGHPPDVVVSHANRLLVGMEGDLFATCCYVDLNLEEGTAWCVRAGHLPPVLRHPDGTTEVVDADGGPPLGVVADADFPMNVVRLVPGATLLLLTDGLVESAELPMDDGLRRLCEALSAADPAQPGIMADALVASGIRRADDVALLLLRFDGMETLPTRARWVVWRLPEAVSHARRFTQRTLRNWGLRQDADALLLIVSELVTNALVHTEGQVHLDLTFVNERVRVAVSDSSPRTPVRPTNVSWEATGGRGILLVEAMSTAWGSVPLSGGKQVWSEVAVADL
jgi:GAF domain-containing protein/anti-sigma regulatory factor (Ser/Thr protein kinase)